MNFQFFHFPTHNLQKSWATTWSLGLVSLEQFLSLHELCSLQSSVSWNKDVQCFRIANSYISMAPISENSHCLGEWAWDHGLKNLPCWVYSNFARSIRLDFQLAYMVESFLFTIFFFFQFFVRRGCQKSLKKI